MSSEETSMNVVRANIRSVVDQVIFERIFSDYNNWHDLKSILNDEEFRSNYGLSLATERQIKMAIRIAVDLEATQQATANSLGSCILSAFPFICCDFAWFIVGSKLWNFLEYYVPSVMRFGHGTHSHKEKIAEEHPKHC
eukprot:165824_1